MTSPQISVLLWSYPVGWCIILLVSNCYGGLHGTKNLVFKVDAVSRAKIDRLLFWLHVIVVLLLLTSVCLTAHATFTGICPEFLGSKTYLASILSVFLIYFCSLLPDPDWPYSPLPPNFQTWLWSMLGEVLLMIPCFFGPWLEKKWKVPIVVSSVTLPAARIFILSIMSATFFASRRTYDASSTNEERDPLLRTQQDSQGHGSILSTSRACDAQAVSTFEYLRGFRDLIPYLWPSDSSALQARAALCFGLLAAQRVINILVPHQLGVVVDHLGEGKLPLNAILLYALYRGLQGHQGVIGSLRVILWIPISQSAYRRLTVAGFDYVMRLSMDFHLSKHIGEVTSALSKGSSINTFLDGLIFQLCPLILDLCVAALYFLVRLDALYAIIVVAVTWFYLFTTIYIAKYRGRARREAATREREMEAAKTDAIMSYETVHHNSAMPLELSRFQRLNFISVLGVLFMCLLAAFQISEGQHTVAMFVTVLTYLAQLQSPLNFFGTFYTQAQNNMVDAERMLALFKIPSSVKDSPGAMPMTMCQGKVSFSHVHFAYDSRKPALADVCFEISPGTSIAIVGESGSGKSTILKLLFRFYEVENGVIKVDNVDIRDITIGSLRSHFGVVPQDTILFNETIMYNLLYPKPDATVQEVQDACKVASIHDKIMSFPDGYETKVGERGLKLSGGEKQRIAIARMVLKRPQIILLDEATASLDSQTETQIQESLQRVSKGHTTITIAHRLSTITSAERILVMHRGQIVERGTHEQLVALRGYYKAMWERQIKTAKLPTKELDLYAGNC